MDPKNGQKSRGPQKSWGSPTAEGFSAPFFSQSGICLLWWCCQHSPSQNKPALIPVRLEAQMRDVNPKTVGLTAARKGDCKHGWLLQVLLLHSTV